jgi:hypothetical protein
VPHERIPCARALLQGLRDGAGVIEPDIYVPVSVEKLATFVSLLERLGQAPTARVKVNEGALRDFHVGTFVQHERKVWRVVKIERSDDWFEDQVTLVLRQPWNERPSALREKVVWLEDQFLPRMSS